MATKIAFIKAAPITNVRGRLDYISNPERQKGTKEIKEKLLAFYQTPEDPNFWKSLARFSQSQGKYHQGQSVVEAREHMLQISNEIYNIATPEDHLKIATEIAENFKKEHGVECAVGIHMNDDMTDYHAHILFAERCYVVGDPDREPAKRNTYFDENGKRSTKAACTDENGKLKRGCRLVKKGETFPSSCFGPKQQKFARQTFLREEKERQAKYMTALCREYGISQEWIRYDHKTNPHMRLYNLKRGEPEGLRAWKERENETIRQYNATIDEMLEKKEITVAEALQIKQRLYSDRAEHRQKIREDKEAWKRFYESRREAFEQRRRENQLVGYSSSGRKRGTLELVAILGLTIAGVDLFRENVDVNEDLVVVPRNMIKAKPSQKLQAMVDELCIAAGRKTPAQMIAERKVEEAAAEVKKLSLADQIFSAEKRLEDSLDKNDQDAPERAR